MAASGSRCKSNYNFYITRVPRFIQHINLWGLLHLKLPLGKLYGHIISPNELLLFLKGTLTARIKFRQNGHTVFAANKLYIEVTDDSSICYLCVFMFKHEMITIAVLRKRGYTYRLTVKYNVFWMLHIEYYCKTRKQIKQ